MKTTQRTKRTPNPSATKPPPSAALPAASVIEGYLLKREVAARLRKQPRTIERWMSLGILPFLKVGTGKRAAILFKWPDVEAALLANYGHGGSN
jgi:hypothetical protein